MKYYPVFLDMTDRPVLVVGGGYVALQKIEVLLQAGAKIKVIAKELIAQEIKNLPVSLEIREYSETDIIGASVVIAATNNSDINKIIFNHAKKHNILLNSVDDKDNCDFILGAITTKGDITVTVSTAGKSPVVAKKLRDKINNILTDNYSPLLETFSHFRIKAYKEFNAIQRKEFFKYLETDFDNLLENIDLVKKKYEELKGLNHE